MARFLDILTAKYKIVFEPPAFLELIATSLHLHLDDMFVLLRQRLEKPGTLHQDQLLSILKEAGYPTGTLLEWLEK
jgi:hypothetical protein